MNVFFFVDELAPFRGKQMLYTILMFVINTLCGQCLLRHCANVFLQNLHENKTCIEYSDACYIFLEKAHVATVEPR